MKEWASHFQNEYIIINFDDPIHKKVVDVC